MKHIYQTHFRIMDGKFFLDTLAQISQTKAPAIDDLQKIWIRVMEIFLDEPNVIQLNNFPCIIVSDTHGYFKDLLNIFKKFGMPPDTNYVFLGDYIDRGPESFFVLAYLFTLKALYPKNIYLIRGNHEDPIRNISFKEECARYYKNFADFDLIASIFRYIPLCVLLDSKIMCIHAGISPYNKTIENINCFDRLSLEDTYIQELWNDPNENDGYWEPNLSRKTGCKYSELPFLSFMERNKLSLMIRGHQTASEGYRIHFQGHLLTLCSTPSMKKVEKGAVFKYELKSECSIISFDVELNCLPIPFIVHPVE